MITEDEGVRPDTTVETLAKLRPAFGPDGTITAGTSSPISDGAGAVVVMSRAKAEELGPDLAGRDRRPRQRGRPGQLAALAAGQRDPRGLRKEGIAVADLDLIEINEAFAAVGIQSTARPRRRPEDDRQRQRRRDRARPPDRHVRRPAGADPRAGAAPPRRRARCGRAVRRRRPGRRADHPGTGAADRPDAPVAGPRSAGARRAARWAGDPTSTSPASSAQARDGRPAGGRPAGLAGRGRRPGLPELAAALAPLHRAGAGHRADRLARAWASPPRPTSWSGPTGPAGQRVGVLAVDPSSPFTGGAILGDRVRMQDHATDPGVYIRSMSSRGHLGGLAGATPQAVRVLEGAGCDVVLVETVGVGQAEVEVASLADTTLVLLAPGHGRRDPGGEGRHPRGRRRLRGEQGRPRRRRGDRPRPAAHDLARDAPTAGRIRRDAGGAGPLASPGADVGRVDRAGRRGVVTEIDRYLEWATASGALRERRLRRAEREIEAIAVTALRERMGDLSDGRRLAELAGSVVDARTDPYRAADDLLTALTS